MEKWQLLFLLLTRWIHLLVSSGSCSSCYTTVLAGGRADPPHGHSPWEAHGGSSIPGDEISSSETFQGPRSALLASEFKARHSASQDSMEKKSSWLLHGRAAMHKARAVGWEGKDLLWHLFNPFVTPGKHQCTNQVGHISWSQSEKKLRGNHSNAKRIGWGCLHLTT